MQIGSVKIDCPIFLAPMAGITDLPYRILARELGCGLVYSEMISDKGINYNNEHTLAMLRTDPAERPLVLQLFGAEPDSISRAAAYVESMGIADIIDINMGCPAPKVVKNQEGSALMRTPDKAFKIMQAVQMAVKIPVTVKLRSGWDSEHINVVEMAKIAEAAGMAAVAVHGRTREAFYAGKADWQTIAAVKQAVKIPVIGNGDVRNCQDLERMLTQTGCDAVMIGRGAQGNPWIFRQLRHFWETGEVLPPVTLLERTQLILRHLNMLITYKGDYIGTREMRKHATWYTKGLPYSAELRQKFNQAETPDDFTAILMQLLETAG